MATTDSTNTAGARTADHVRRANPMGAHVATAGVVVFLIATYLDWVSTDGEPSADDHVPAATVEAITEEVQTAGA